MSNLLKEILGSMKVNRIENIDNNELMEVFQYLIELSSEADLQQKTLLREDINFVKEEIFKRMK